MLIKVIGGIEIKLRNDKAEFAVLSFVGQKIGKMSLGFVSGV